MRRLSFAFGTNIRRRSNDFTANMRTGQLEAGDGRLNDWMGGERIYRVSEDVIGLGQYGRTLTVLTCHGLRAINIPDKRLGFRWCGRPESNRHRPFCLTDFLTWLLQSLARILNQPQDRVRRRDSESIPPN